jgi:hypothetical protein
VTIVIIEGEGVIMPRKFDFDTNEQRVLDKVVEEAIEIEESHQKYLETEEGQEQCFQLAMEVGESPVDERVIDSIEYEETLIRIRNRLRGEG